MKVKCNVCGKVYYNTTKEERREARYQGRVYEPYPAYCPNCGSDEVIPHE